MEEELEKVRTFYARKIEEVQRKAEQKVWYYKRGVQPPVPPVDTATTDQHEYESIPVVADKVDKEKLVNKISLLESELAEALDRLAQAHNQLTSQSSYINHHLISLHTKGISSDHNIATVTATDDVSTHSRTASVNQRELHNGQTQLVEQLQDALTNVRNELVFIQNENTKAIQQHQQKNTQLASEIELLRLKLAEKPKPPQLQQFLVRIYQCIFLLLVHTRLCLRVINIECLVNLFLNIYNYLIIYLFIYS